MTQSLLKISIISFLSINFLSFGMAIPHIEQFPEELRRHIFVLASPSIQNQLKLTCQSWHAIGAKKAPNMYKFIDHESFRPSQDDWRYIMMHAAWWDEGVRWEENVEVMRKILDRTKQRNFDYVSWKGNGEKQSLFLLCDMPVIKRLHLHDDHWLPGTPEKFKELNLASDAHKTGTSLSDRLLRACFFGDSITFKLELNKVIDEKMEYDGLSAYDFYKRICWVGDQLRIHCCLWIATYNDNPHFIKMLSILENKKDSDPMIHLNLLYMAIRNQKKQAFRALVENNVYGCLNDVRLDLAHGGINATTLDMICKQRNIPHLDEYIALYRELGGRTLQEMGYDEQTVYDSSSAINCVDAIIFDLDMISKNCCNIQ
jgi:hypothetical protein